MKEALGSHRDAHLVGAHFLVYGLISGNSALDMQPDSILDQPARFFLCFPLGIATLEGRTMATNRPSSSLSSTTVNS
jgi:hypothetical protein